MKLPPFPGGIDALAVVRWFLRQQGCECDPPPGQLVGATWDLSVARLWSSHQADCPLGARIGEFSGMTPRALLVGLLTAQVGSTATLLGRTEADRAELLELLLDDLPSTHMNVLELLDQELDHEQLGRALADAPAAPEISLVQFAFTLEGYRTVGFSAIVRTFSRDDTLLLSDTCDARFDPLMRDGIRRRGLEAARARWLAPEPPAELPDA